MKKNITLSTLLEKDYKYDLEYDYDTETHCDEWCQQDYCRCSTIENCRIKKIPAVNIANSFCELSEIANNEFAQYCVHRAVISSKIWHNENWEILTCRGYYGEELESIKLELLMRKLLNDLISKLFEAKTNKEKLFLVLNQEYGYILPKLKSFSDFEIIDYDKELINAGAKEYYKKLDSKIVEEYRNYTLPIGVGIFDGEHISLIDGYHRLAAASKKSIRIIVGK